MKRQARIELEIQETLTMRRRRRRARVYCPLCECDCEISAPDLLTTIPSVTEREVFRLIETGEIFFVEGRRVLACRSCVERIVAKDT